MNKNIPPELQIELQEIANKDNVAIISFIAPDGGVRTSPVSYAYAQIQETEMYELEKTVNKIPKTIKELHLVIHTPGGELHTSYKIAAFLRKKFEKITAFVPYQAASGGTLICCAANEIVISEIGNITPVDPQVRYKDVRVSAYAFERSVETIKNLFGEYSPMEMPPPWRQMAEKMDPIIYDEMDTSVLTTLYYIKGLLEKSGYTPAESIHIAMRLVKTMFTHSYSILKEDAKGLGLKVVDADATIMVYQKLVAQCLKLSLIHI